MRISLAIVLLLFLVLEDSSLVWGADEKTPSGEVKVNQFKRGKKTFHRARVLVKAPAETVWNTIHEERSHDPDIEYSKIISANDCEIILEQKFNLIPVIGTAVCRMKHTEHPYKRIEYYLVDSDRFKSMEGSWIITPQAQADVVVLELNTHLDMGLPVPPLLLNTVTSKKLIKRLGNVKKMAEDNHKKNLSTKGKEI